MTARRTALAAAAVVAAMFFQPAGLLAKPGSVTANDGVTYIGDVSEGGGKLTVTDDQGSGIEIDKTNVKRTTYFESAQEEYSARMGQLVSNDVRGRIVVAKWAMKHQHPELAKQALDAAIKIDPTNGEAIALRKTVEQSMPANTGTPGTPGAPQPAPAAGTPAATRLVTKDEINRIRQLEWQPNDEGVRVAIDKDTRAAFIARSRDLTPAQFNRMTPPEQARVIIKSGTDKMRNGVRLTTDPATIKNYKTQVQKPLLTGCAAAGCHDAASKTNFVLHTEPTDEATYTNYLVLQSYRTKVKGVERLMIDRDQPMESLLSEFALSPKAAATPHPEVPGYVGLYRNVQDPKYKMLAQWLKVMPTIPPNYDVDLSKPPAADEPAAPAAGDAPAAPAPGAAPAAK